MAMLNCILTFRHILLLSRLMNVEDASETLDFRAVVAVYGRENLTGS